MGTYFNSKELDVALVKNNLSKSDLANILNISNSTLWRKINNSGDFTREEISKMIDILGWDDTCNIFFCNQSCKMQ